MHVTWLDIQDGKYQNNCGGCIKFLSEIWDFPARSRFGHGDLCSECGTREAFEGDFIGKRIKDHLAQIPKRR